MTTCEYCYRDLDFERDEYVRKHVYRSPGYENTPAPGESEYQHLDCYDEGQLEYD
jgi:hypothetical protein